jgi:hypothetical protein
MQISDDVTREDMAGIRKFRTWKFSRVIAVLARLSVHVKVSYFVQCLYVQSLFPLPNQNLTYNMKCIAYAPSRSVCCRAITAEVSVGVIGIVTCILVLVAWYHLILQFEYQYFSVHSHTEKESNHIPKNEGYFI